MASQVDQGPASGTGVFIFGTNGGGGLEVHIGNPTTSGLDPLAPGYAPYQAEPGTSYTGAIVNKVVAGIQVSIPS